MSDAPSQSDLRAVLLVLLANLSEHRVIDKLAHLLS